MTEVTEKLSESITVSIQDEIPPLEEVEITVKTSQDVSDSREELEQDDGPTAVCAAAADASSSGSKVAETQTESGFSKWEVGAPCQAVWSEDGLVYPAKVVAVDGDRCRVRFNGYGNEEDKELSSLKSPSVALQTEENRQVSTDVIQVLVEDTEKLYTLKGRDLKFRDWKPGSRCRAVYSEDGLVYPAVVLWVNGQRCRVRYDNYNNEEDQYVGDLLKLDELHGPGTADTKVKGRSASQRKVEREAEEKRGRQPRHEADKPTNHSFSVFPPFPSPQSDSGDAPSFIPPPPPPPLWMFGGKESSVSASVDTTSSMLMLWYMCGFHTGSYMAQQLFRSTSKD